MVSVRSASFLGVCLLVGAVNGLSLQGNDETCPVSQKLAWMKVARVCVDKDCTQCLSEYSGFPGGDKSFFACAHTFSAQGDPNVPSVAATLSKCLSAQKQSDQHSENKQSGLAALPDSISSEDLVKVFDTNGNGKLDHDEIAKVRDMLFHKDAAEAEKKASAAPAVNVLGQAATGLIGLEEAASNGLRQKSGAQSEAKNPLTVLSELHGAAKQGEAEKLLIAMSDEEKEALVYLYDTLEAAKGKK
eukprot:GFYU01014467.1.p1 GENE.GFYU01014467.1~~GFYU01014467.1.p1  ORF type:complete len:245 (-),score=61.57 GFYU01014467.1:242-976(-)